MLQMLHSRPSHWPLVDIVVLFSTWLCSAARIMLFNNGLWTTIGDVLITISFEKTLQNLQIDGRTKG
jgi:hypothetical protein